jgi:hypothetical protein
MPENPPLQPIYTYDTLTGSKLYEVVKKLNTINSSVQHFDFNLEKSVD